MRSHALALALLGVAGAPVHAARENLGAPVAHHGVHARIAEPATGWIEVRVDARLEPSPASKEPWRFLLHRGLAVSAIECEGSALRFEDTGRFDPRRFWRRPPYAELAGFEIAREIAVDEPKGGWPKAPVVRVTYAGIVADSLHAPVREYGRSFETTSGRIVAEGATLNAASFWVPWSGDALFTFDLEVECPAEWRAITQGDLVADEARGSVRAMRWRCGHPSQEIHLVAGPYRKVARRHGAVSLETWCYANTEEAISAPYLDAAATAIDRFSAAYGTYPFSKFALVENYWQTGYGMPSFTLLGSQVIRLPFIVHTSFPHEILHNWWGNGVYVEPEQGNWCEGLTAYGADYAAKEIEGGTAARDYRRDQLVGVRDFALAGGRDFALVRFRKRESGATEAVGYGKTLMVFHMLRRSIGRDAFDASLRRLYTAHRFRRAGWDDVRAAFEQETGRDLRAWFEQWVMRPGAPSLSLTEVALTARGDRILGVLVQEPPTFDLEVPIVVAGAGRRVTVDVKAHGVRTAFDVAVDFAPETIAADPEFHLFRVLHDGEIAPTLSGVLGATAVRVVVGANVAGEAREALLAVAKEWAADTSVVVVEEAAGVPLSDFDGGTWFFGDGGGARKFVAEDLPALAATGTIVAAGRLGGAPKRPAALLQPRDAAGIAAVARKIPHYSKYSWLAFDGDKNVAKGVWDPGESGLVVRIGR